MRKFALKDSNVVIICYDVQKRKSFDNVKSVWIPEIRQFLGKSVPIILVGILSSNMKHRSVSRREAIEVTSQMLIRDYFEIYGDDNVEISCLFSYIASIAKKSTKRNLSFLKRLFVKWHLQWAQLKLFPSKGISPVNKGIPLYFNRPIGVNQYKQIVI